jgi:serine/threonine-protein kinase
MTEELLNALAKVKGLRVPGRSSSFAFKGRTDDDIFRQVGDKLHVHTVLEGSVRKVGDKLRITAQLINCADGNHLWSEEYDRSMADLLAVQTEVAQQVTQKLQVALGVDESRVLAQHGTENAEAHRLYLLGRFYFAKNTEAGWTSAEQYFNEAIRLDPTYALAYCGLADNYGWLGGSFISGKEAWAKERELAQKALALAPDLAEAHFSLAEALTGFYDWSGVEREFNRALELAPNLALIHDQFGWWHSKFGRFDEAVASAKRAVDLDPLSPSLNNNLGSRLYSARRYDEAKAQARRVFEMDASYAKAHGVLEACLRCEGNYAAAIEENRKGKALDPSPGWDADLGYDYARMGERAKAEQILRDLEAVAKKRHVSPSCFHTVYLGLGDKEKALDWLERCYEERDGICWDLKAEPTFDDLRNEPRFQALLKKVGLDK